MIVVVLLLVGLVVAGTATNLAEGRGQRAAVISLCVLLAALVVYAVHLARQPG